MTSHTEFIPISTIFNETGIFSNAIRWFGKRGALSSKALLMGQLRRISVFTSVPLPREFTVSVWHGIHSLGCTEQKKFVMCVICMLYSSRTRFQPKQSSASATDNPQRNRVSLVSLAIVHLALEALIACDYHFLWRFCHV